MNKYLIFLIKSSFDDLRRNKVRTFLTSLGILIGVFSVVMLIALGVGIKNYIKGQFESLGTNLLFILPGQPLRNGSFSQNSMVSISFKEEDVVALRRAKTIDLAAPIFSRSFAVDAGKQSELATVVLTSGDTFTVRNLKTQVGQLFSNNDVEKRDKIAVIGPKIAEKLFGSADGALGKSIRLEKQKYRVIGVLEQKGGGFGGPDLDAYVYIPYKSAIGLNPDKKFNAIQISTNKSENIPQLKEEAQKIMLKNYKEDEFSVVEQTEILNAINQIFNVINMVLVAIASISLIVGGVGIMNIMYAAVTERIKEIGIRRAIGATQRNILLQFLSESLILSLFGGISGLILAALAVLAVQKIFPAAISPQSVLVGLGVSSVIGVFFGVFPASRAAKLSPIDAIRYE